MIATVLEEARRMVRAGARVFVAKPDVDALTNERNWQGGIGGTGFWLPKGWQDVVPDEGVIDQWQEGDALCVVTGGPFALIDVDPRNGGDIESLDGAMPKTYWTANTPSGGQHFWVASLGVRSKDGAFGGIDIKDGEPGGRGRGFGFIAPTKKLSKTANEVCSYEWTAVPSQQDLAVLSVIGDTSGRRLANLVRIERPSGEGGGYSGPPYASLDAGRQGLADTYVLEHSESTRVRLEEAAGWVEGQRNAAGRGWEALVVAWAWEAALMTLAPWTRLDEDSGEAMYRAALPDVIEEAVCDKWERAIERAAGEEVVSPPWAGLDELVDGSDGGPGHLDDARITAWIAEERGRGLWCWAKGMGWLRWDDRRWAAKSDESLREWVRAVLVDINIEAGGLEETVALLQIRRINAIVTLLRGPLEVEVSVFDTDANLLNCSNGVVDMSTGELLPHDSSRYITKITEVPYVEGSAHVDWAQCLSALDPEVVGWLQVRLGQGATGHITSDDVLPVMQGGGSNGKSTLLSALKTALGEHMVQVPAKLIVASPSDHPTELMSLRGARLAYLDETPEGAQVNIPRLKAVLGQPWITARAIRQDNVTWKATHSLFMSTNYTPMISETDHGTWRRLALVRFEKTFPSDERFRDRMVRGGGGRAEAVLAWLVEGARRWYDDGLSMPAMPVSVEEWTKGWRTETDLVMAYLDDDRVAFEEECAITSNDLFGDFSSWLRDRGQKSWSQKLFTSRFESHQEVKAHKVRQERVRDRPERLTRHKDALAEGPDTAARITIWWGLKWVC